MKLDFSNLMELTWSHDWFTIILLSLAGILALIFMVGMIYGVIQGIINHIRQRRYEQKLLKYLEEKYGGS